VESLLEINLTVLSYNTLNQCTVLYPFQMKLTIASFCFLLCVSFSTYGDISIVTSIRPLALMAEELAAPGDKVEHLLSANTSPHHYQLKVSDRRQLDTADLVVWIGPELETFLQKVLVRREKPTINASDIKSINWPEGHHDHGHDHHGHKHHRDPHLWLDPYNLGEVAQVITEELIRLNPEDKSIYRQNNNKLLKSLAEVDQRLRKTLPSLADQSFIVLHPAYNHFTLRYGLNQVDYIVPTPERGIGAKHLYKLRELSVDCVFGEEGQDLKMATKIANHVGANMAVLDPLGAALPDKASITGLIDALGNRFIECLSPAK
jgi:zinc transport system substrate-binding protein